MERWTFLTNYGHVFLCLAAEPAMRMRELAERVGITERSAQRIVADLIADGYVSCERVGRRNHYRVHGELPLRHPNEEKYASGALLAILKGKSGSRPLKPRAAPRGAGADSRNGVRAVLHTQSAADRRRKGAKKERVARASSSTRSRRQTE
jgi:DNA-binding Lrp family transcriptional regulator